MVAIFGEQQFTEGYIIVKSTRKNVLFQNENGTETVCEMLKEAGFNDKNVALKFIEICTTHLLQNGQK